MLFIIDKFKRNKTYNGNLPCHIGIIMDGNGRWAKKRGLPRKSGHREGAKNLNRIVKYCDRLGIKYLTVYAFSTENWSRPKSEVDSLMELLMEYLSKADEEFENYDIKINVLGSRDKLDKNIIKQIDNIIQKTSKNKGLVLNIAFNYGGRDEIVSAIREIASELHNGSLKLRNINESLVSERLYTKGMPDPDLIIRPSGEKRMSNFLIWQSSYTEFWFSNILWPNFREKHLLKAISEYNKRKRRFGGI